MVPKMLEAEDITRTADIFVVIGTSLNVYPAANLLGLYPVGTPAFLINPVAPSGAIRNEFQIIQERATIGVIELQKLLETHK